MRAKTKRAKSSTRAMWLHSAKESIQTAMSHMTKRWSRASKSRHLVGTVTAAAAFLVVLCVGAAAVIAMRAPSTADSTKGSRSTAVDSPMKKPSRAIPSSQPTAPAATPDLVLASNTTTPDKQAAPVTIAGCLEQDGQKFRLTQASGAEVPKARSWKSGFLRKKATSSVDVVDNGNKLKLPRHVGHRVNVTGTMEDREMHARSVQTAAGSCS